MRQAFAADIFDRELDLQKALKLSEEEEAKRRLAVEDANSRALFDDNAQPYVEHRAQRWLCLTQMQPAGGHKPVPAR